MANATFESGDLGDPRTATTDSGFAVSLEVRPLPAWRGQPLAVTVRVRDRAGAPRAGMAVTVQTGIGRLVYMFGFTRVEGAAITVLTGADGTARLDLVTPPREPLSEVQQAALEYALAPLDAAASDPLKLESALRTIAVDYARERNYNLRRAIDVHVREFRDTMIESLNPGRWRLEWPVDAALVQADAVDAAGGGSSVARAVCAVAWKNWIGAWIEFHADLLREGANLAEGFARASSGDGSGVLDEMLLAVRGFAAARPGRAAEWLAAREIASAVRDFVGGDLGRLEPAARAALVTELEVAAREVRPTSAGNYSLVSNARAELNDRIASVEATGARDSEHLRDVLVDIERSAALVEARAATVVELVDTVRRDRAGIDGEIARLEGRIAQFATRADALGGRLDVLDTRFRNAASQIEAFDARVGQMNAQAEQVSAQLGRFHTQISQLDAQVGQFNARINQVQTQLGQVATRVDQADSRLGQFDSQFAQFSTGLARFNADLASFNANRKALVTRIEGLQSDVQGVRVEVRNLGGPGGRDR